jgi:hypothetical protein
MDKQFLEKLMVYLNSAEVFVKDQAPQFVQQFMDFQLWQLKFMTGIFATSLVLGLIFLSIAGFIQFTRSSRYDNEPIGTFILGMVLSVAGVIGCVAAYNDYKMLEIAPKVYMAKQATDMFSGHCSK